MLPSIRAKVPLHTPVSLKRDAGGLLTSATAELIITLSLVNGVVMPPTTSSYNPCLCRARDILTLVSRKRLKKGITFRTAGLIESILLGFSRLGGLVPRLADDNSNAPLLNSTFSQGPRREH